MKRSFLFIFIIYLVLSNLHCNSVTGEVIDDYNRAKNPIARLDHVPDAVVTLDEVARNGNAVIVPVGGSEITSYRYRINQGAWSQAYDVFLPITIADPECGTYKLDVIGSITDRYWQPYNMPTTCSWQVVPGRASLKGLSVLAWEDSSLLELTPGFEPHGDTFTVTVSPDVRRVVIQYREFDDCPLEAIAYRVGEYGEPQDLEGGRYVFLVDGANELFIDCTGGDGSVQTYKLVVNRRVREWMEPETISSGKKSISIYSQPAVAPEGKTGVAWCVSDDISGEVFTNTYENGRWNGETSIFSTNELNIAPYSYLHYDLYGNPYIFWLTGVSGDNKYLINMAYNNQSDYLTSEVIGVIPSSRLTSLKSCVKGPQKIYTACSYYELGEGRVSVIDSTYKIGDMDWKTSDNVTNGGITVKYFSCDMDWDGNVINVYMLKESSVFNTYARIYNEKSGWETPHLLHTNSCSSGQSSVKFDDSGNAIAVWFKNNGSIVDVDLYANYYSKISGWLTSSARLNKYTTSIDSRMSIGFDAYGNAIVVWRQKHASENDDIWINKFDVNTKVWSGARAITAYSVCSANSNPQVAFDQNGNAVIIWGVKKGDLYGIESVVYNSNENTGYPSTWSEIKTVRDFSSNQIRNTGFVMRRDGSAHVIWVEDIDGLSYLMSSVYR